MKEKLITIKPFLNTKLVPIITNFGEKCFPLYYQITFNRNNTQLKSTFEIYLSSLDEANSSQKGLIEKEIKNLQKIVQLEILGKKISLTGIKNKHTFYLKYIDEVLQEVLIQKIQRAVSHSNSEYQNIIKFEGAAINVMLLHKAIKILIDNYSKYLPEDFKQQIDIYKAFSKSSLYQASIISWLDEHFKNQMKQEFLNYFDGNQKEAEKSFMFIDSIITERIKYS